MISCDVYVLLDENGVRSIQKRPAAVACSLHLETLTKKGRAERAPSTAVKDRPRRFRELLLLHHFCVNRDRHFVADDHAAVVHRRVPLHAKILAIDLRGRGDGGALIAPRIFHRCGRAIYVEYDGLRRAANRQITGYFELPGAGLLNLRSI